MSCYSRSDFELCKPACFSGHPDPQSSAVTSHASQRRARVEPSLNRANRRQLISHYGLRRLKFKAQYYDRVMCPSSIYGYIYCMKQCILCAALVCTLGGKQKMYAAPLIFFIFWTCFIVEKGTVLLPNIEFALIFGCMLEC